MNVLNKWQESRPNPCIGRCIGLVLIGLILGCGKSDPEEKQEEYVSQLKYSDVDPATASKGTDEGELLIESKGIDSQGKEIALSDGKGKVMLIISWASW